MANTQYNYLTRKQYCIHQQNRPHNIQSPANVPSQSELFRTTTTTVTKNGPQNITRRQIFHRHTTHSSAHHAPFTASFATWSGMEPLPTGGFWFRTQMESMNKNNEFVVEQGKNCAISTIDYSQPTDHHYIPCVQHPVCVYMETTDWPTESALAAKHPQPFPTMLSTFLRTFVSVCIAIVDCRERCILFFGDGECVIKKSLFQMCIKKTNWYAVSFTYRRTPYIYIYSFVQIKLGFMFPRLGVL